MNVPAIADVAGAFRWAAPGDVALLDADHGFLVINPSRAEVATVRAERKNLPPSPPPGSSPRANDAPISSRSPLVVPSSVVIVHAPPASLGEPSDA